MTFVLVHWGTKYPPIYLAKMARRIREMVSPEIPIACLTDRPRDCEAAGLLAIPTPVPWPGWWQKILLFDRALMPSRYVVYCDLDVVFLRPWRIEEIAGADWSHAQDPCDRLSSSLMFIDTHSALAAVVRRDFDPGMCDRFPDDQDHFVRYVGRPGTRRLPAALHFSYKCLFDVDGWSARATNAAYSAPGPAAVTMLNFHGYPKPHEIAAAPQSFPFGEEIARRW